ncbi:MAG: hypothetical protein J0I20_33085 [Chloroflexi bacterium]|nr:hypothetical protein [Chloroflexota bacterium]
MQRTFGNQAVQRMMKQTSPVVVQRSGLTAEELDKIKQSSSNARNFWQGQAKGGAKNPTPTPTNRENPQGSEGASKARQFWANMSPGANLKNLTTPPEQPSQPKVVENVDLEYWENHNINEPIQDTEDDKGDETATQPESNYTFSPTGGTRYKSTSDRSRYNSSSAKQYPDDISDISESGGDTNSPQAQKPNANIELSSDPNIIQDLKLKLEEAVAQVGIASKILTLSQAGAKTASEAAARALMIFENARARKQAAKKAPKQTNPNNSGFSNSNYNKFSSNLSNQIEPSQNSGSNPPDQSSYTTDSSKANTDSPYTTSSNYATTNDSPYTTGSNYNSSNYTTTNDSPGTSNYNSSNYTTSSNYNTTNYTTSNYNNSNYTTTNDSAYTTIQRNPNYGTSNYTASNYTTNNNNSSNYTTSNYNSSNYTTNSNNNSSNYTTSNYTPKGSNYTPYKQSSSKNEIEDTDSSAYTTKPSSSSYTGRFQANNASNYNSSSVKDDFDDDDISISDDADVAEETNLPEGPAITTEGGQLKELDQFVKSAIEATNKAAEPEVDYDDLKNYYKQAQKWANAATEFVVKAGLNLRKAENDVDEVSVVLGQYSAKQQGDKTSDYPDEIDVGKKSPVRYGTTKLLEGDIGEDLGLGEGNAGRAKLFKNVAKQTNYLNKITRKPFQFTIKGGIFTGPDGKPLDSSNVLEAVAKGSQGGYIFVMTRRGKFYYADSIAEYQQGITNYEQGKSGERVIGFHHSTFKGGGAVAGAGEIQVAGGKLVHLTDASGHYMPKPEFTYQVLLEFQRLGVDISQVKVYYHVGKNEESSTALEFLVKFKGDYHELRQKTNWKAVGEKYRAEKLNK